MQFTRVTYNRNLGHIPARVNHATGELQLNPDIWNRLNPDYRQYILLHEEGHLKLQTTDEAAANQYAISKFLPVATLTNEQLQQKITVLSEITNPARTKAFGKNEFSNFGIIEGVSAFIGYLSKQNAESANNLEYRSAVLAQSEKDLRKQQTIKIAILGGSALLILGAAYLIFRK